MNRLHSVLYFGVFSLTTLIVLTACYASNEISPTRPLSVCVDMKSFTGLGNARRVSGARVVASVSGARVELEFVGADGECSRFRAFLADNADVSSVTAIEPTLGAVTLINVDSDEVRLRIRHPSTIIERAKPVAIRASIQRTEDSTLVYARGDGVSNAYHYGLGNDFPVLEGASEFEFELGRWLGAPDTTLYIVEKAQNIGVEERKKIARINIDRSLDSHEFIVDFTRTGYPQMKPFLHRSNYADGILSCGSPKLNEHSAYAAFGPTKRHADGSASAQCLSDNEIQLSAQVYDPLKWVAYKLHGAIDAINAFGDSQVFINIDDNDGYTIPNISHYNFDAFRDGPLYGNIKIDGAKDDAIIALIVESDQADSRFSWHIFSSSSDSFNLKKEEAETLWDIISEVHPLDKPTAHLLVLNGYDDTSWKHWAEAARTHHSFFWIHLNPDYL